MLSPYSTLFFLQANLLLKLFLRFVKREKAGPSSDPFDLGTRYHCLRCLIPVGTGIFWTQRALVGHIGQSLPTREVAFCGDRLSSNTTPLWYQWRSKR